MDPYAGASSIGSTTEFSSMAASQIFDVMGNAELVQMVDEAKTTNRQDYLENYFFSRYLHRNEGMTEEDIDNLVQVAAQKEALHRRLSGILSRHPSAASLASARRPFMADVVLTAMGDRRTLSVTRMTQKEGPRINLSHKIEMCTREIEELRASFEKLTRTYAVRTAQLKAEIEELQTTLQEIRQTTAKFEDAVIEKGFDPLSKRIQAEVFVRFMENWLQSALLVSGHLRLETSSMRVLYKKRSTQLQEKIELGDMLQSVDFDYLKIKIAETSKQLQERNLNLSLLKEDTASTHRQFAAFKDVLGEQLAQLERLRAQTADSRRRMQDMTAATEVVKLEGDEADRRLAQIKRTRASFTVPEVIDYARVKQQAVELRREIKVWTRRATLQHSELIAVRKALKEVKAQLFD